jgi:hypothetical protein
MGTALVVVGDVPFQHRWQVSLVDNQESVGHLASERADEPLGVTIRAWTTRRNLHGLDTSAGEDIIE